jgi:serine/threonine-protein kinase HipA
MNGERVGLWAAAPSGDTLTYDEGWAASARGRPLSLSLPFLPDNRPLRGALVRAWFENLLPDSRAIRERIARRFHVGATDPSSLLAAVGRDCVGAVQIVPAGEEPAPVDRVDAVPLSDREVANELSIAVGAPGVLEHQQDDELRLSLAGAQEKAALLFHDGRWMRPRNTTPTTHIFKLPMGVVGGGRYDLSESIENEFMCLALLRAFGIPVASAELARFGDYRTLIVERFDRRLAGTARKTWYLRLPQEDLAQAFGRAPAAKYEADGGPGIAAILALLANSERAAQDRATFLRAQVLFFVLGAPDGHAKNFSIALGAGGAFRLTPLYDILSAYPFLGTKANQLAPQKLKLAMALRTPGPHWYVKGIGRRHFEEVAARNGLGDIAGQIIDDLVARAPDAIETAHASLPRRFPTHVRETITAGVERALAAIARR